MPLLTWDSKYSVNVQQCDAQHKKLIDLINQLHDAIAAGQAKGMLGKILDELLTYTSVHFTAEEQLMKVNGYPAFAEHKKKHDDLVQQVSKLRDEFRAGKSLLSMEVMQFLRSWLLTHIQGTDKLYSAYLNSKGVS